jgi:ATP-dependent RNA helicase SUPV3L1/SUV3
MVEPTATDEIGSLYPAPPAPTPPANTENKLGLVTAFERADLNVIRRRMATDPEPIQRFGVVPTHDMIELFCSYFPVGIPYSFILARILDISQVSSRYFFCDMQDTIQIADIIQPVKNLSIAERIKVCFAPVSIGVPGNPELIREMADAIANQSGGDLLDIKNLNFDCLDEEIQPNRDYLVKLEILHKGLVLYLWMSFRFPGVFIQRPLAIKAKMLVEDNIDKCLNSMKYGHIDATRLRVPKPKVPSTGEAIVFTSVDQPSTEESIDTDVAVVAEEDVSAGERHTTRDDAEEYPELEEDVESENQLPKITEVS